MDAVKTVIDLSHLEQLKDFDLIADERRDIPGGSRSAYFDTLLQWTHSNIALIRDAKRRNVFNPQTEALNFNTVFLAFMESAAMYLRENTMVVQAVEAYRTGNRTLALDLLERSTAEITKLADAWGMDFVQVCDLVTHHPDGHSWMVGPFCGAFYPKEPSTANGAFIGIAFKQAVRSLMARIPTPLVHVAGHSLGGAYSSLCYAQARIEGIGNPRATIGDLYTLGSPRVGRGDFAKSLKFPTPTNPPGRGWRIVSVYDPVTQLPASPPFSTDPFIHLDSGVTVYPDLRPTAIESEIGTYPTWSVPTFPSYHYVETYYQSIIFAATGKKPTSTFKGWGGPSSIVLPNSNRTYSIDGLDLKAQSSATITLEASQKYVVGTIKVGRFVGEITALGQITGTIDRSLHFSCKSWEKLYAAKNQCVFEKVTTDQLAIYFLVDDEVVGYSKISGQVEGEFTGGNCTWAFDGEDNLVKQFASDVDGVVARIFDQANSAEK